jgi:hypothetical protein
VSRIGFGWDDHMIDLLYIGGTIVFFALMIRYAAACDRLGRAADVERAGESPR